MQWGFARQARELILRPDFNAGAAEWIQAELDFKGAQTQGHLIELTLQADRSVFAYPALDMNIEERVEIEARL